MEKNAGSQRVTRRGRLRKSDSPLAGLLSSPAMARLIAHFVLHSEQSMHFRALQRHTALPHRSLQTELGRLEALGVVTRRRDGRHVTLTANAKAPLWSALRQVVRHVAHPAELLRDALADATGIEAAFVFGSTARGNARPDSDVDLFLVGSFGDTTDLAARTMEVSTLLQREVNVARYTAAELKNQLRGGSPFLERVMAAPKGWVVGGPRGLRRIAA